MQCSLEPWCSQDNYTRVPFSIAHSQKIPTRYVALALAIASISQQDKTIDNILKQGVLLQNRIIPRPAPWRLVSMCSNPDCFLMATVVTKEIKVAADLLLLLLLCATHARKSAVAVFMSNKRARAVRSPVAMVIDQPLNRWCNPVKIFCLGKIIYFLDRDLCSSKCIKFHFIS